MVAYFFIPDKSIKLLPNTGKRQIPRKTSNLEEIYQSKEKIAKISCKAINDIPFFMLGSLADSFNAQKQTNALKMLFQHYFETYFVNGFPLTSSTSSEIQNLMSSGISARSRKNDCNFTTY